VTQAIAKIHCLGPLTGALAGLLAAQALAQPSRAADQTLQEVTVTARKQIDPDTLDHVVIPKFVESHGTPSERVGQIGRWVDNICPEARGLQPLYNEYVSRRVISLARSVGAPTQRAGHCAVNVDILFTPRPQDLLDEIARKSPALLGHSENPGQLRVFRHPIEARYLTGTRSFDTLPTSVNGNTPQIHSGLQIDNQWDPIVGLAGSHLGDRVRSEFARVTVIADTNALVGHSIQAVTDYIAMLVLTRSALDGCNPLPSILDLLSSDCGGRPSPASLTEADIAYLKALYSSNLEVRLNLERGELHDRMLRQMLVP
jgi:hypothetical protein